MTDKVTYANEQVDIKRLPVNSEEEKFHDWTVKYKKSHILHSQCSTPMICHDNETNCCAFCLYAKALELPHLPEMVFAYNSLLITHVSGAQIEFNALDALKRVESGKMPDSKVACAEVWQEARSVGHLEEKIKPFDWTFSSDYRGSVSGPFNVVETEEKIDINRLKERERILFYHDLMLYEDELHDNGIASCTVKIRVMPTSFFVLLRYFLRVDNVMVRVNDTRLFHDFSTNYILREYSNKECGVKELNLPLTVFGDPNVLSPHMPLRTCICEKLIVDETTTGGSTTSS